MDDGVIETESDERLLPYLNRLFPERELDLSHLKRQSSCTHCVDPLHLHGCTHLASEQLAGSSEEERKQIQHDFSSIYL